jgi:catechol 2,3-dioxygenase-like lactoylglutathione lyase family enzyme
MLLGIDHLVIAAADPDRAADRLADALGLTVGGGGRHERLGTLNRLIWLGDSYLEIIGVFDPAQAAASWLGRLVVRTLASGGGLATWAVTTDDIDRDVRRLRAGGAELTRPERGTRTRPDGQTVRWSFSLPSALEAAGPPFLIEHDADSAEWQATDRSVRAAGPGRLSRLEIEVGDVRRATADFSTNLGVSAVLRPAGARFEIGSQRLDIRPARGRGPTVGLLVAGRPPATFDMAGCRWAVNQD